MQAQQNPNGPLRPLGDSRSKSIPPWASKSSGCWVGPSAGISRRFPYSFPPAEEVNREVDFSQSSLKSTKKCHRSLGVACQKNTDSWLRCCHRATQYHSVPSVTVLLNSVFFIITFTINLRGTSWLCRSLRVNLERVAKGCHLSGAAAQPRAGPLTRI